MKRVLSFALVLICFLALCAAAFGAGRKITDKSQLSDTTQYTKADMLDMYDLGYEDGYRDGSKRAGQESTTVTYILNANTHKFHYPTCKSVDKMSEKNKVEFHGTREEAIQAGYDPCKNCNP